MNARKQNQPQSAPTNFIIALADGMKSTTAHMAQHFMTCPNKNGQKKQQQHGAVASKFWSFYRRSRFLSIYPQILQQSLKHLTA